MNSIAIRNGTDGAPAATRFDRCTLRIWLGIAILAAMWISPTPFGGGANTSKDVIEHGSLVNQLSYATLFLAALAGIATLVHRRVAAQMPSLGWLVMVGFVVLSGIVAPDSAIAMRSVVFAVMAAVMAASVPFLSPDADGLSRMLLVAATAVLALCYLGILVWPQAAIHQASETEAVHAGLWRGVFTHKNIAGPVMASLAFVGIYLARRGWRVSGALIALAALVFIVNTGSKTTAILVPAVMLMVMAPAMASMRIVAVVAVLFSILTIHALTVGTVFVPFLDQVLRTFDPATTFTGRIEIWELGKTYIMRHPWTGFGYDSFWLKPVVDNAEVPFDWNWDPRGIVNGHNGFLDIALFMGFPALLLSIWLFVLVPLWQYLRVPALRENVLLADLCMMIVAFTVMNSALESFFFRRANPIWLTLVLALFGLRLCARVRIRAR